MSTFICLAEGFKVLDLSLNIWKARVETGATMRRNPDELWVWIWTAKLNYALTVWSRRLGLCTFCGNFILSDVHHFIFDSTLLNSSWLFEMTLLEISCIRITCSLTQTSIYRGRHCNSWYCFFLCPELRLILLFWRAFFLQCHCLIILQTWACILDPCTNLGPWTFLAAHASTTLLSVLAFAFTEAAFRLSVLYNASISVIYLVRFSH